MMEVTILGRGKSLEKLKNFKSESDIVILVNEFWKTDGNPCDYYKELVIANFIKEKNIVLVGSPAMGSGHHLTHELELEHNIISKFNTVWPSGSGTDREQSPVSGWRSMPDECVEDYKFAHLSGELKQFDVDPNVWQKGIVRGSLAYGILLSVKYYNADKINIFGLDFYEIDYLVPQSYNYENEKKQVVSMKNDFTALLKFYQQIKFNVYTLANYNPDLENVTIL